jgi:hypothetical protein
MSNTPCAYAVDSVLHRRVEIKVVSSHRKLANTFKLEFVTGDVKRIAGCKDVFRPISQGIPKPSKVHHIDSQALFDLVSAKYLYKSRAYSHFFIAPTIPPMCKQSAAIRWL